jgi:Uma2 family endonuclease
MSTVLRLGPADHNRAVSAGELAGADFKEGYRYEVVQGRLYVSPAANMPHDAIVNWVFALLLDYSRQSPDRLNGLSQRARVFVPNRPDLTVLEPDIAAYEDWPATLPRAGLRWEDHSPLLVAEVVSEDDPDKDLDRNVRLYRLVPSVREYWVLDPRADADRPTLHVYRRRGDGWARRIDVAPMGEYTTRLLPGFRLPLV